MISNICQKRRKGGKNPLTRLHKVDSVTKETTAIVNHDEIEDELIKFNTKNYLKAHSAPIYNNPIIKDIGENENIRDKILKGTNNELEQ